MAANLITSLVSLAGIVFIAAMALKGERENRVHMYQERMRFLRRNLREVPQAGALAKCLEGLEREAPKLTAGTVGLFAIYAYRERIYPHIETHGIPGATLAHSAARDLTTWLILPWLWTGARQRIMATPAGERTLVALEASVM